MHVRRMYLHETKLYTKQHNTEKPSIIFAICVGIWEFVPGALDGCTGGFLRFRTPLTGSSSAALGHRSSSESADAISQADELAPALLPLPILPRYIPPSVKRCLSCQYSSGPRSPLYIGPQPSSHGLPLPSSPHPASLFQGTHFAPKASK